MSEPARRRMNIKKGEMKMEMESQEGKTERLRAEWGQEGRQERVSWKGFRIHWQWHGDSNSPPHRRKLVDITAAKTLLYIRANLTWYRSVT